MDKEEFLDRRVDDFEIVDNTLRDMVDVTDGKMHECIVSVIGYLYDIFEMPEDGFDEKRLDEIRKVRRKKCIQIEQ